MRMSPEGDRLVMPIMLAFRKAFAERDARKPSQERIVSGRRVVGRDRSAARGGVSEEELRRDVVLAVDNLLNTVNLNSTEPLDGVQEVSRSIINFGIPDLVHRTIDEVALLDVVEELETALACYEPRIVASSLHVRRDLNVDPTELKVRFVIDCDVELKEQRAGVEFLADIALDSEKILVSQV